jgi:hypothetical protein
LPVGRKFGDVSGDVETAVGSETGEDGLMVRMNNGEKVSRSVPGESERRESMRASLAPLTSSNVNLSSPPRVEKYLSSSMTAAD